MPNNTAIYISKNFVDLVQLTGGFGGFKVINSIRIPIAEAKTEQAQSEATVAAIKEAVKKANLKNLSVIFALPAQETIIRCFQIPILPHKERHNAIIFEAKKYIPFRLEEIVSDYSIESIQHAPTAEVMDVVFTAVKKESLTQYLTYLTQSGLTVKVIEPASLSLLRWYKCNSTYKGTSDKAAALLELGGDNVSVTLTIVKRDMIHFVREIALPKPVILEGQVELDKEVLERLSSEIHISFEYYKKWFQKDIIERIVLFSQATTLPPLIEFLSKEIDIPIESGAIRKGLKTSGYLPPELYLAAGAALRDNVKTKIKLNLYHIPKVAWFEGKAGTKKAVMVEIVLALLFLVMLNFIFSLPLKSSQARLNNIISNRPQLEQNIDINSFEALKEAKDILVKKRTLLSGLIKNKVYWTPRLDTLVNLVPEGVWITNLEFGFQRDETLISGRYNLLIRANTLAPDQSSIDTLTNKFLDNLKNNRYFSANFKEMSVTSLKIKDLSADGQGEGQQLAAFEITSQAEPLRTGYRHK